LIMAVTGAFQSGHPPYIPAGTKSSATSPENDYLRLLVSFCSGKSLKKGFCHHAVDAVPVFRFIHGNTGDPVCHLISDRAFRFRFHFSFLFLSPVHARFRHSFSCSSLSRVFRPIPHLSCATL